MYIYIYLYMNIYFLPIYEYIYINIYYMIYEYVGVKH